MTEPAYLSIEKDDIAIHEEDGVQIKVLSGEYKGAKGVTPRYIQASIYDIEVEKGREVSIPKKQGENAFVFLIEGDAIIDGRQIASKTAVLFDEGEVITVKAPTDSATRLVFFSSKPLREPISWGGPIVMNTKEELNHAFDELQRGTFIKHN